MQSFSTVCRKTDFGVEVFRQQRLQLDLWNNDLVSFINVDETMLGY